MRLFTHRSILPLLVLMSVAALGRSAQARAQAPRIFFTDLPSAPNVGGESVAGFAGAYVTLFGNFFGTSQGSSSVTLNGSSCLRIVSWGTSHLWYQRIVVQLGAACSSGSFVVTTAAGSSNPVAFAVHTGHIYFVSPTGSDGASGSAASPWQTIQQAAKSLVAGDVAYLESGVTSTSLDNYNADLWLGDSGSGTASLPIALLAYPGATVTVGDPADLGLRGSNLHGANDYWVIAGLTLVGGTALELDTANHWRVIANDLSCPTGSGETACFHVQMTVGTSAYGNHVHDVGTQNGAIDKFFHGVYFTTDSNSVDVGWNEIDPNSTGSTTQGGCRALQFYSTGGSDQYDLHVHDNVIHDAICDGINFATVDPDKGTVEAYNNLVYHVGTGPDPANGAANYSCVNAGSSGTPTNGIALYNNTFHDCGARLDSDSGGFSLSTTTVLRNNLLALLGGEPFMTPSAGGCGGASVSGSHDLWFGGSDPTPSCTTVNVTQDPAFANAAGLDFHLLAGSPAIDRGVAIPSLAEDLDGITRPQGAADDIGAYEFLAGAAVGGTTSSSGASGTASTSGATGGSSGGGSGTTGAQGTTSGSTGTTSSGTGPTPDGGPAVRGSASGCGCSTSADPAALVLFLGIARACRRRRRGSLGR